MGTSITQCGRARGRGRAGRTGAVRPRALIVALALVAGVAAPSVLDARPAVAAGQLCLSAPPTSTAAYRAIADHRTSSWGIGDLTTMLDLPDGRRLFLFGDTGYFDLRGNGSRGPITAFGNNSAWLLDGRCVRQLDGTLGDGRSWLSPPEQDGTVYWPGGAAVAGDRLHVFLTRLRLDNVWGTPVGSAVATFELPSLRLARIANVPFDASRIFGSGAVHEAGYLYAYGSHRRSCPFCFAGDVYVARVPEHLVQVPTAWRYFADGAWVRDVKAAKPVLRDAASNTNVVPWRNGFLMVSKTLNIVGPDVDAYFAPDPQGPWQHVGTLYAVPHPPPSRVAGFSYADPYTYNASVLPTAAVEGGGVLLAYNVGSFDARDGERDGLMYGPRFVSVTLPAVAPASTPPRAPLQPAPWDPVIAVDRLGRVSAAGGSVSYRTSHTSTAVGVARTVTGGGSWAVASDGGVFSVGDAAFHGSTGGMRLNQPVVGIGETPTGVGYWLVASDGGVFSFGDARFFGSTGSIRLNKPVFGMAPTPTGRGYWLVASDGGVFSFGDAKFFGSTGGMQLTWPVTDLAPTPTGRGYYLVTLDGLVYAFGDAVHHGNAPRPLAAAIVGLQPVPGGYRLVDTAGRVQHFGASTGPTSVRPPGDAPIVAIAS